MNSMCNLTFDEIELGSSASLTRKLTKNILEVMALVSRDINPFYLTENGKEVRSQTNITQAAGAGAFVFATLGTNLPGPGMKIIGEDLKFSGTINTGDEVTGRNVLIEGGSRG